MNYLWPYEEVQMSWQQDEITLSAPWLKMSFPVQLASPEALEPLKNLLREGPQTAEDVQGVHTFFQPVEKYPFFYYLPNPHRTQDQEILKNWKSVDLSARTSRWSAEEILELSMCPAGGHDPVSVLSALRRHHLLDATLPDNHMAVNPLRDFEGDHLRTAILVYLRQNHFVTQMCQQVLSPAQNLHEPSRQLVCEFMNEEKGHDKLLYSSIKSLGVKPEDLPVLDSLKDVMQTFETVAGQNLVAFSLIVDMFERSSYGGDHPLVKALLKLGEADAAKPIQSHVDINHEGDHDLEAFELLSKLGAVCTDYVKEAIGLSQMASEKMFVFARERTRHILDQINQSVH